MYCLSFSEAFFSGNGEMDIYDVQPSGRPTSVYQALLGLPKRDRVGIARDVLRSPHPVLESMSESFEFDVLNKVRETDLCADLRSPVRVYIDPDQRYSVKVYDERDNSGPGDAPPVPSGWESVDGGGSPGDAPVYVPNLDVMEADELRDTADRIASGHELASIPDDVRALIVRYASLRLVAMSHRLAGRIQSSIMVGHQKEVTYASIPERYRW